MADVNSKDENFWKSTQEPPPDLEAVAPSVAPPPEVRVRTLRTDLESMAKSGGALPQFQAVKAPRLPSALGATASGGEKNKLMTAIIALVAIALLGAVAFLAYQLFLKSPPSSNVTPAGPRAINQPATRPQSSPLPSTSPLARQGFVHHSLLKKPADQLLVLTVRSNVENATDLQTFNQRVIGLLAQAKSPGNLFEINVKNTDGKDLDINEIFSAADIGVLDSQFVSARFNLDPTFFVYRDKNGSTGLTAGGLWPGFIISLKPTENWLFIKNDVAKLEKSSKVNNFFLSFPGDSSGDFKDDVVSGQPVRVLTFTAPGAVFIYGWFRGNLILSTSLEGLKVVLAGL